MLTTDIENFPGFPEPLSGPELMERIKAQAVHHGTRVVSELVKQVDFAQRPFTITPSYSEPVRAHTVIIATGAAAKWIGLDSEIRLAQIGGGVSACAVCDGAMPFYRNKRLAVVGGGDTAMEEAMYLTKFASEVVIVHRRDSFRASKVMANRVLSHPKVRVLWNSRVTEVLGGDFITGLQIEDTVTGEASEIEVGGLFVAIGHTPNTKFLGGQIDVTEHGYIKVSSWRTATNVEGVFAAGDVIDDYYRQAITSAGTGCMAALEAERWLAHHGIGETPVLEAGESAIAAPAAGA
jgi:thioredoxin reductase (NADPH)